MPVGYWIVNVISDQACEFSSARAPSLRLFVLLRRSENHSSPCRRELICVCVWCSQRVDWHKWISPRVCAPGSTSCPKPVPCDDRRHFCGQRRRDQHNLCPRWQIHEPYSSPRGVCAALVVDRDSPVEMGDKIDQQQFRSVVAASAITGISTLVFALYAANIGCKVLQATKVTKYIAVTTASQKTVVTGCRSGKKKGGLCHRLRSLTLAHCYR